MVFTENLWFSQVQAEASFGRRGLNQNVFTNCIVYEGLQMLLWLLGCCFAREQTPGETLERSQKREGQSNDISGMDFH